VWLRATSEKQERVLTMGQVPIEARIAVRRR
jgi:hypothetical protein